jgi:hypothetical protein
MFDCRECGHGEMVHEMWTGCCGHAQCPCEGFDGTARCRRARHDEQCWWAYPKRQPEDDPKLMGRIRELHFAGVGVRRIAAEVGIHHALVRALVRPMRAESGLPAPVSTSTHPF